MSKGTNKPIEEFIEGKPKKKVSWPAFIESDTVNFFNLHDLEKMTVEDGNGNKARLTRQKDNSIKVEYSSTTII
jgi:hypothetical protein